MPSSNLAVNMGYKGSGKPQAIPVYVDNGAYLLGGVPASDDANGPPSFGRLVSVNPAASADGILYVGIPSGYIPIGIAIYEAGIAQEDPSRRDLLGQYSLLTGQPTAVMSLGQIWMASWSKTVLGAIDPVIGCQVVVNNTTGIIEFIPVGQPVPTGWTAIAASVKSVTNDTSGALLFLNF